MVAFAEWLNPTRSIGLISYLFAAVCSGVAWTTRRASLRLRNLAAIFAVLEVALFLDVAFSVRWRLHDLLENAAIRSNLYAQRTGPQLAALALLALAAAVGITLVSWRFRGRSGAIVAACGAIFSVSIWCAEVVSLHTTDEVFYYRVGGVMLVSLCWIASSLMTGLGILWESRAIQLDPYSGAKAAGEPPLSVRDS